MADPDDDDLSDCPSIPEKWAVRSQEEVARLLGMSRTAVAKTERIALRKLRRAMEEMGVTAEDLFGPK